MVTFEALEQLFAGLPVTADWTLGFFTAVWTGPDAIDPTTWTAEIVRGHTLANDPGTPAKIAMLTRLYTAVGDALRNVPETIPPEPDKPASEVTDFCTGYMHGARMHAAWVADEAAVALLAPFEAWATGKGEPSQRNELGRYVAELNTYWKSKRQVVRTEPKVGRNDPCPCGSGKKHKKCCLASNA